MNGDWPMARKVRYGGRRRGRLWFGLLGGAVAWMTHLGAAYMLAEFGCIGSLGSRMWLGISLVAWMCIAVSGVTEAVALLAIFIAYSSGPESGGAKDGVEEEVAYESRRYTSVLGIVVSSLFALAILFESIPIVYYLSKC